MTTPPELASNDGDQLFQNPKQSMLSSFNYKCPVIRENSLLSFKRR